MVIQCMIIISWQEDTSSAPSICSRRENPFGKEVYPLACTNYTSVHFTMSKRTLTMLNERLWINAKCLQQRRNAQMLGKARHLAGTVKVTYIEKSVISMVTDRVSSKVCVCVCVKCTHKFICFRYFNCHCFIYKARKPTQITS